MQYKNASSKPINGAQPGETFEADGANPIIKAWVKRGIVTEVPPAPVADEKADLIDWLAGRGIRKTRHASVDALREARRQVEEADAIAARVEAESSAEAVESVPDPEA